MRNPFKDVREEFNKQLPVAQARHRRALARPKSKEARSQNRKFGLLLLGLAIVMAAPQLLALSFDEVYYPRLALMTGLLTLFSFIPILTGWIPKQLRR